MKLVPEAKSRPIEELVKSLPGLPMRSWRETVCVPPSSPSPPTRLQSWQRRLRLERNIPEATASPDSIVALLTGFIPLLLVT